MDEVKKITTSKESVLDRLYKIETQVGDLIAELEDEAEGQVNEVTIDEEDEPKSNLVGYIGIDLASSIGVPESFEEFDERINNLEKAMAIQQRLNELMIRGVEEEPKMGIQAHMSYGGFEQPDGTLSDSIPMSSFKFLEINEALLTLNEARATIF